MCVDFIRSRGSFWGLLWVVGCAGQSFTSVDDSPSSLAPSPAMPEATPPSYPDAGVAETLTASEGASQAEEAGAQGDHELPEGVIVVDASPSCIEHANENERAPECLEWARKMNPAALYGCCSHSSHSCAVAIVNPYGNLVCAP